jgi:hypothetical protein
MPPAARRARTARTARTHAHHLRCVPRVAGADDAEICPGSVAHALHG